MFLLQNSIKSLFVISRYQYFYEEAVNPGSESKKVRCLLCGNGSVLSLGSFSRHVFRVHEEAGTADLGGLEVPDNEMSADRVSIGADWFARGDRSI